MILALSTSSHDNARFQVEHELDDGSRLVWELLDEEPANALAAGEVELAGAWVARLDRVDFPPGGVAYRHGVSPVLFLFWRKLTSWSLESEEYISQARANCF